MNMNEPKDPAAAESDQTTNVPAADTPETDAIFGGLTATDAGYWKAVSMCRDLERQRNDLRRAASAASVCSACVTVEFLCDECGEFDVIKSKSTLVQFCGCGKEAKPIRIVSAAIKLDGKWFIHSLPHTAAQKPPDPAAAVDPAAICPECNGNGVWEQGVCLDCAGTGVNPVPPEQRQCVMCKEMGHYYYECNNGEFFRSMGDAFGIHL